MNETSGASDHLIFVLSFLFKDIIMTWAIITALLLDFIVAAVVHIVLTLEFMWLRAPLVLTHDV